MTSWLRRFGITLAFLGFASILPATPGAQCPVFDTQWGSLGSGDGQFNFPYGVATDATTGDVYVADTENHRIQKFTDMGTFIEMWGWGVATGAAAYEVCTSGCQAGIAGSGDGQFNGPQAVATDATTGDVYVADTRNNRIQKFDSTGGFGVQWGTSGLPDGVATDAAGGVYVTRINTHSIRKFTSTGGFVTEWGSFGPGEGEFAFCSGVGTDAAGDVYVTDTSNHRVQKFRVMGTTVTFIEMWGWGVDDGAAAYQVCTSGCQAGILGSGDGQFNAPNAVATDAAGDVYVLDNGNARVQKFTGTMPRMYLCKWGSGGPGDGQFNSPRGIATDAPGDVYVADAGNHRIQKFGGLVSTEATSWGRIKSIYR